MACITDRRNFLIFSAAGLIPAPLSDSPLSPQQVQLLLERIAATYAQASRSCSFDLTYQPPTQGEFAPSMRIVLDRFGPLWRIDLHGGRDFLYILGQERVWDYHPDQREYLENPLTHERA